MGNKPRFWMKTYGALMCDQQVEGAQTIDGDTAEFYGGRFFIGETITEKMGRIIAESLGGDFVDYREVKKK